MKSKIKRTTHEQHAQLINIWNECIKYIPHLFTPTQLNQIQALYIEDGYHELLELFHVEIDSTIVGAIGLFNDKIEMILVSPHFFRQGICRQLVEHVTAIGARYVDISEQHQTLFKIFTSFDFKVIARSELDAEGYPNPILHLMKPYLEQTRLLEQ